MTAPRDSGGREGGSWRRPPDEGARPGGSRRRPPDEGARPGGSRRPTPITAGDLEGLLADLAPIGRDETGATTRLAWTPEDEAAAGWFARWAAHIGRRMVRDLAGNLWACPDAPGPWWAAGSHLDTVRGGGRFDGALGVAAAFAAAARSRVPLAVVSFADEEGARFNTPTFGSRALTGRLDCADALDRVDDDGVPLGDAMADSGVDPDRLGDAPEWLGRLRGFLELHVDQTRDLAAAGVPAGVVARLASRLRLQLELTGRADHAGTTRRGERRDALAAAARLIVRGEELAGAGMVFTAARIEVEPNAPTTVASRVRLWLDVRAADPAELAHWHLAFEEETAATAERSGVLADLRVAALSDGVTFDGDVRAALAAGVAAATTDDPTAAGTAGAPTDDPATAGTAGAPTDDPATAGTATGPADDPTAAAAPAELVCFAGHDAGILAERVPAGMVLVRNATGVSHSLDEEVDLADAAVAANALLAAVERLGG